MTNSQPTCTMMGRAVAVSSSADVQEQRSSLSLSHFPLLFLPSCVLSVRFSLACCSLSRRLLSSMTGPPKHNQKRSQTHLEKACTLAQICSKREDKSEFLFSFWCFFGLWLRSSLFVLSSAPVTTTLVDATAGYKSEEGSAQGLQVEERGECGRWQSWRKELVREGGREGWREGVREGSN